jgi:plasmid stabilization system protein ParE
MNITYLRSTVADMRWWRGYFAKTFPEGRTRAEQHFLSTIRLIEQNPEIGMVVEGRNLRKLLIRNTRFMIIYRIRNDQIEIVRVWDTRQKPYR